MTEAEAHDWIIARFGVSRETALARYADLIVSENARQNLVSTATLPNIWSRHFVDSAQLIAHVEHQSGAWLDVGSGAGLPGLVIALLTDRQVVLAEPRRRRADFLLECAAALGVESRVTVHVRAVERLEPLRPAVISARAVAALDTLLNAVRRQLTQNTILVLPKGRSAESEVAAAKRTWHGRFDLMPSVTDPDARIVLIRRAAPR